MVHGPPAGNFLFERGPRQEAPGPPPPRKRKPATVLQQKADGELASPRLEWLRVRDDAPIVGNGYPTDAPLVNFSRELQGTGLLGNAPQILADLLGEEGVAELELHHDPEWEVFPEVGEAIKGLGEEDHCICVALSPQHARWAVGVASKWKHRENAARLALSVAFADQADPDFAGTWPGFAAFAAEGAFAAENVLVAGPPEAYSECGGCNDVAQAAASKRRRRRDVEVKTEADEDSSEPPVRPPVASTLRPPVASTIRPVVASTLRPPAGSAPQARPNAPSAEGALPRDEPLWVRLPEGEPRPTALESFASEEGLVVSTEGKRKGLYSQAESALAHLAADAKEEIQYHDDFNWQKFPEIGKKLKEIAPREECLTVATCASLDVWAVGVGMKGKQRWQAAKVALATAIAVQALHTEGQLPDLKDFPSIAEFVEEARVARESLED